jgi:hypothetical protein
MVLRIVQNTTYKGQKPQRYTQKVPHTPEEQAAYEAWTGHPYKYKFKHVELPEEQRLYHVDVPALVDEATWEDANKQLDKNR